MKPTIEQRLDYIETLNDLTQKTWDHLLGAFLGTIITVFSAIGTAAAIAMLGATANGVGVIAICIACAACGVWIAAPWFSYHAVLSETISDWAEKYDDE